MKFAIITGTREWSLQLQRAVNEAVDSLPRGTVLLAGDARGADEEASRRHGFVNRGVVVRYPAPWNAMGALAGPVRNAAMVGAATALLEKGWECVGCWAFPSNGSRGTWDCVKRLEKAGFQVTVRAVQ